MFRFKRGYNINEQDIWKNVDGVLLGEVQSWYRVNRRNSQPKYANVNTRYFYNNQKFQNIHPRLQSNNEFLNNSRLNYNKNFRNSSPTDFFRKREITRWEIIADDK